MVRKFNVRRKKPHREHIEIVAVYREMHCKKAPSKCGSTFSYYIVLSKEKNNNDKKSVIDILPYKKRLSLEELLSN